MKRLVLFLTVLVILAGCGQKSDEETVKIGYVGPLAGSVGRFGLSALRGAEMAIEDFNESGGLAGKKIELVVEESKCEPKSTVTALNKLINFDKIDFIVGPLCAAPTSAAVPVAEQNKIVMISTSGLSDKLSADSTYMFRMVFTSEDEGRKMAKFARDKFGSKKAYLVYFDSEYGYGYRNSFVDEFERLGGSIVEESTVLLETDFRSLLTKVKNSGADVLYSITASGGLAGNFYKQEDELGIEILDLSNYAFEDEDALAIAGDAMDDVYYSYIFDRENASKNSKNFIKRYEKTYNDPFHVSSLYGYDAIVLFEEAARECGLVPTCVRDYLRSGREFEGVSGKFRFNDGGGAVRDLIIKVREDGEFKKYSD